MGQHGSPTNVVHLDDCRIPAENIMGAENDGFRVAVAELAGGRTVWRRSSLGIARRRDGCGQGLCEGAAGSSPGHCRDAGPAMDDREIASRSEASRLLILNAAVRKDRGEPFAKEASMAKLFASEAAHRCTDTAIQLFGGAGYCADYPVERYARDARITRIYEGTSESPAPHHRPRDSEGGGVRDRLSYAPQQEAAPFA